MAGRVRSSTGRISVGLPPVNRDLSLLLASTSVLSKIIERARSEYSDNRGVLVVSVDLRVRSLYCDLLIRDEPLDIAFPGSRMLPNGRIQPLGRNVHKIYSGVCFYLPHHRELPKKISIQPDLIILDLRYGRLNSKIQGLVNWAINRKPKPGIMALYTIGDRICRKVLDDCNFKDFPLDHCGINTSKKFVRTIDKNVSNAFLDLNTLRAATALSRKHILKDVEYEGEYRKIINNLVKLFSEHNKEHHVELNRLRWLFAVYSQMPVPLVWHERIARARGRWVPNKVIQRIGTNTRDIGKLAPILQTFRANFKHLNRLYEEKNPKCSVLKKVIESLSEDLSEKNKLLILVRDEVMEVALSSWLTLSEYCEKDWLEHIDVIACKKYFQYTNRSYKYFISPGPVHYKYRWILGANIGSYLHFLVYPHEVDVVKKQINQFYDPEILKMRAIRRQKIFGITNGDNVENLSYPELMLLANEGYKKELPAVTKKPKEKVKSFDALYEVFQEEEKTKKEDSQEITLDNKTSFADTIEEEDIVEDVLNYSSDELNDIAIDSDGVQCVEIIIKSNERGKGKIWVPEYGHVEFIRPQESSDLIRSSAEKLKKDDLLLIVDNSQQNGIFERLIEIADSSPQINYISVYRNIWRKAVNVLSTKYQTDEGRINFESMYQALQQQGIKITTLQTIRNWVNDIVIGPEDVDSIVAVARVSGISEMSKHVKEFNNAFEDIRKLHRCIGRKVASAIRKSFKIVVNEDVTSLDEELQDYLDLPLNEIINAIEVVTVLDNSYPKTFGIVPSLTNRFIKIKG